MPPEDFRNLMGVSRANLVMAARTPGHTARKSTDSSKSDLQLLRNAGFTIRAPRKNPYIKDRVAAFNLMICNSSGDRRYLVNESRCPVLLESIEKIAYDDNGLPNKHTGHDHPVDAVGYFIHQQFPIVRKQFSQAKLRGL